jgi:hypothetical protein
MGNDYLACHHVSSSIAGLQQAAAARFIERRFFLVGFSAAEF